LETSLEQTQDNIQDTSIHLELPMKRNNNFQFETYTTKDLAENQQDITAYVLSKLQEWFTCVKNGTTTNFTPLRVTICGEAGSGKTVLINTLVTLIRQLAKKNTLYMSAVLLVPPLSMLAD
jgi:pantothenate kinase-related protein Tda10